MRPRRVSIAVFALAFVPRLVYLLVGRPPFDGYHWTAATDLLAYGVIGNQHGKSTELDPLYIACLAAARLITGDRPLAIQTLQLAVDSAGAVGLYWLTTALTGRHRAALISAALYAFYPLLVHYSVSCSEYALLSVLLIAFARAAVAPPASRATPAAGLWLGIAILTRSAVAPIAGLATALFAVTRGTRAAALFVLTVCAIVSPWLIRNYAWNGTFVPTRSGANLFVGNSRYTQEILPEYNTDIVGEYSLGIIERDNPELLEPASEAALDRHYTALAREQVRAHPGYAIRLVLSKAVYHFWPRLVPSRLRLPDTRMQPLDDGRVRIDNSPPRPLLGEIAYSVPYVFVATAALAGIWMRRRHMKQDAVLWCVVLSSVAVSMVYFPATRFRVSMEFVLLFYAAVAIDSALRRTPPALAEGLPR